VRAKPAGTRVRSSSVEGRRRAEGSSVDGRASNGTRDRGIMSRLFSDDEAQANPPPDGCLWVGRERRVPGWTAWREGPVQVREAPPCRWSWVVCECELSRERLPALREEARRRRRAAFQRQIPVGHQAGLPGV